MSRGVLQDDITSSPLYFILTLELILRRHDSTNDKGVALARTILYTLVYTGDDDVLFLEYGDQSGTTRLSDRVMTVNTGSKSACLKVMRIWISQYVRPKQCMSDNNIPLHQPHRMKPKPFAALNAPTQVVVTPPPPSFLTERDINMHKHRCQWKNEFKIEKILDHKGTLTNSMFHIRWKGCNSGWDSWVP